MQAIRGGERVDVLLSNVRKLKFFGGAGNDKFSNFTDLPLEAYE